MILVSNIACPLDADRWCQGGTDYSEGPLVQAVAHQLDLAPRAVESARVVRRSIDARKKGKVHFVVSAAVQLACSADEDRLVEGGKASHYAPYLPLDIPSIPTSAPGAQKHAHKARLAVVVGTGPAGLFAALVLARAGARPLVVERGANVDDRARIVAHFAAGGKLDPATNIQFGEGGAGTFSDGKLTTNTRHPLAPHVLHWFAQAGAPESILWEAHPHIGSDNLPQVVRTLRTQVQQAGGQVLFGTQMVGVHFEDGVLAELHLLDRDSGRRWREACAHMVVACGHSARDTFEMLEAAGLAMQQKPFSLGVRIEHAQQAINQAQWGAQAGHAALGAAEYKLVEHVDEGRSVYTFCMCPGGQVACAASEPEGIATNGMSPYARDGANANAALLVNVDPADFGAPDALAGVRLQRRIEQRAFQAAIEAGGAPYQAPAQTVGSFLAGDDALASAARARQHQGEQAGASVKPSYARGVAWCSLRDVLPDFVCRSIEQALPRLDRKLAGFADPGAVMTAPETRSSSPVRLCRNQGLQAWRGSADAPDAQQQGCGIYPCGEGAGYAGGIMSAAADGLRVGLQVAHDLAQAASAYLSQNRDCVLRALRAGEAVLVPTDTVCGLAVAVNAAQGTDTLAFIKDRPARKPVAWLVASPEDLDRYGFKVPDVARDLARRYWPGPLTIVVKASDEVPMGFRSPDGTIGLRMPDNPDVLDLIDQLGAPLAATSANLSGQPAPRTLAEVDPVVAYAVPAALYSTHEACGLASTVLDCTTPTPRILRQGAVDLLESP